MTADTFFLVDDLKINIEKSLSDNWLSSQRREILQLVYKQVESFEEIAKATLRTNVHTAIRSEVHVLRRIVAEVGSVQDFYRGNSNIDEEEEKDDVDGDDDREEDDGGDDNDNYDDDDDKEEEDYDDDREEGASNIEEEEDGDGNDDKKEEDDVADLYDNDRKEDGDDDREEGATNIKEDDDDGDDDEDADGLEFSVEQVENLKQRIHGFTRFLKNMEDLCADGLYYSFPDEEEEEEGDGNRDAIISSNMIGVCDVYDELKYKLMLTPLTSIVGMPGIGKTALANKIFHDPTIVECFDHRVWVPVGKKCRVKDIAQRILAEIDSDNALTLPGADEEAVHEHLKTILKRECYLIVLDDVWDRYITYLLHPHYRYEWNGLNHPFLHTESKSRILLTSRLQQPNQAPSGFRQFDCLVNMRLLDKNESWKLLCDKVFCKGSSCPPRLEKVGKKISKKCEGLPLMILTVACLLSKEKSTLEYWTEVAEKKNHRLFMDAYDKISKVLLPSYTYLPPLLQMCFLYVGLFPQNYEIPRSRLINLWCVDRFLELNININSDDVAIDCLEELVTNNVVRVYKQSTLNFTHTVKACGLHSSFWHLSKQKAMETKFAFILSSPSDYLGDSMKGHHRLSIHSNVLFGMKDVHKSVEDNCASTARSLLCFGPYHQYQVPLCFRLKLLRELDALSIRFYEFPLEVLQLVRLTYLSLTSNGMIPASISQLQFLKFFIVDQHQSIKSCKKTSYLPVEIWSLPELKHLQVMGSDLPDPCGASLDCLKTLLNVSTRSCTAAVLNAMPNLRKLGIQIELTPDGDGTFELLPSYCPS